MKVQPNLPVAVDAPFGRLFAIVRLGRRATEQECSANEYECPNAQ
jgi:hypothetical protein